MQYHTLTLCGLKRKLPLIQVGKNTKIASFTILGDVELVDCLADHFAKRLKIKKFDYIVAPEVKVLPLVHGVALRLKQKRFMICRKTIKPYMTSPVVVKPLSHFPKHATPLVLNGADAKLLKNKKVIVLDDVISTGITMRMINYLMKKVDAKIVGHYSILKQGKQFDKIDDLYTISELPIFKKEN